MGVEEVMKFVVEKFKEALIATENFGGDALAWFNKIFPPETRGDKIHHWFHVAEPFLIAAVILSVIVCFCRCCCGCCKGRGGDDCDGDGDGNDYGYGYGYGYGDGDGGRMMKAPGRNCKMPRHVFERNPKGYFRNLRAYPGDQLC